MDTGPVGGELAAWANEDGDGQPSFDTIMRYVREGLDSPPGAIDGTPLISRALGMLGPRADAGQDISTHRRIAMSPDGGRPRRPQIALLTVASSVGQRGGAERLYEGLQSALARRGLAVERIVLTSDESSFEGILRAYLRAYDTDLSEFDGVISTKAPSHAVRHRNHVCYLLHTMRDYYDMFEDTFAAAPPDLVAQRDAIRQIDTAAFQRPALRARFAVGAEVRERLRTFSSVDCEVLHHPTSLRGLRTGAARHLLLPGRLHPWKRVDLALAAFGRMRNQIDLVITGEGEDGERLRDLARGMDGVRFTGHVEDAELAALYADALAVLFCPVREDYGLVPVEAFLSRKPVVTCTDSGEPARLVADGLNGFVCAPDAQAIAERLDWLAGNREEAAEMGRRGRDAVSHIEWETVCTKLLGALGFRAQAL